MDIKYKTIYLKCSVFKVKHLNDINKIASFRGRKGKDIEIFFHLILLLYRACDQNLATIFEGFVFEPFYR